MSVAILAFTINSKSSHGRLSGYTQKSRVEKSPDLCRLSQLPQTKMPQPANTQTRNSLTGEISQTMAYMYVCIMKTFYLFI